MIPYAYKVLSLSVLGWALLAASALGRDPDPKAGMKVFWDKGCIRCHPILGEGGNVGPNLTRSPSTADGLELAASMWSHAPQMWQRMRQEHLELPTFELEEMEDLFAFLQMARSLDEAGDAEVGRQLFQTKRCVECHSISGQGGRVGPDLTTVAANWNPVAWVATMWNHAPGMFRALEGKGVAFPRFQGSEMVDLQSYIRRTAASETGKRLYLRPPSPEKGATLFQRKQCVRCHSIEGRGGKVGPDLSYAPLPQRYGEIAVVMWNHAPQMSRLMAARSISYPSFETQELADLLAYLNSLSLSRLGDPKRGAEIFAAKGCSGCHPTAAGASGTGPNLTRLQQTLTPISIALTMWNHGPAMLQRMERSVVFWPVFNWPVFNSGELADTLAYLESIQTGSSETTGGTP